MFIFRTTTTVVRATTTVVRTTTTAASTATAETQSMQGLTQSQYVDDSTRKPRSRRVNAERRQVVDSTHKSVPPQGLIPNRKRKPTPSIAVTSNATSIRTVKRQQ
jgi:hypothetical protein